MDPVQIKAAELQLEALTKQNDLLRDLVSLSRQTVHELAILNMRNARIDPPPVSPRSQDTPHPSLDWRSDRR